EFATGAPLALTDVVINPKDGAMYFIVGGRSSQSALYRVTYTGKESTAPAPAPENGVTAELRALRHKLESLHGKGDAMAVQTIWPHLGHDDRYIRYAARVAIEHQPPTAPPSQGGEKGGWQALALNEKNPAAAINSLLALVR